MITNAIPDSLGAFWLLKEDFDNRLYILCIYFVMIPPESKVRVMLHRLVNPYLNRPLPGQKDQGICGEDAHNFPADSQETL